MSPEQVHGVPTLDERSDIYSMGVVLYELATGRRPFEGEQPFHLMLAHVEQQPTPLLSIILMAEALWQQVRNPTKTA